jgi:hypothetical protein
MHNILHGIDGALSKDMNTLIVQIDALNVAVTWFKWCMLALTAGTCLTVVIATLVISCGACAFSAHRRKVRQLQAEFVKGRRSTTGGGSQRNPRSSPQASRSQQRPIQAADGRGARSAQHGKDHLSIPANGTQLGTQRQTPTGPDSVQISLKTRDVSRNNIFSVDGPKNHSGLADPQVATYLASSNYAELLDDDSDPGDGFRTNIQ